MPEKTCTRNSTTTTLNTDESVFEKLIGNSPAFRRQVEIAKKAAAIDLPVLITGETGTGKEVFARAIHEGSRRRRGPYVAENCSAVPPGLTESIFFGTESGAFTEAVIRKGLFEEADGGTLMLDELNSMPAYLQAKLLRAVQEGQLRRVGGVRDIAFDTRLIASLNEDPETLIREGLLRRDLYYRLNVIRIDLPPLRERKEDIPLYIEAFLREADEKYGKKFCGLNKNSVEKLIKREYPGNVRELRNLIEGAVAMSGGEGLLHLEDLD